MNTLFRDVVPAIPLNIVPTGSQPSSLLSFLLTQWPGFPQLFIGSIPMSVCFMRSGGVTAALFAYVESRTALETVVI